MFSNVVVSGSDSRPAEHREAAARPDRSCHSRRADSFAALFDGALAP
jgi:hypothetical protein